LERIIKKFINQKESVTSGRAHLSELRRRILEEDSKVSLPPSDVRGGERRERITDKIRALT
jgi:hypothetical protein